MSYVNSKIAHDRFMPQIYIYIYIWNNVRIHFFSNFHMFSARPQLFATRITPAHGHVPCRLHHWVKWRPSIKSWVVSRPFHYHLKHFSAAALHSVPATTTDNCTSSKQITNNVLFILSQQLSMQQLANSLANSKHVSFTQNSK